MVQVLLALVRRLGEGEGGEGGDATWQQQQLLPGGATAGTEAGAAGAGDGEGDGADELLFFVSTDADRTMFGRWGTQRPGEWEWR